MFLILARVYTNGRRERYNETEPISVPHFVPPNGSGQQFVRQRKEKGGDETKCRTLYLHVSLFGDRKP